MYIYLDLVKFIKSLLFSGWHVSSFWSSSSCIMHMLWNFQKIDFILTCYIGEDCSPCEVVSISSGALAWSLVSFLPLPRSLLSDPSATVTVYTDGAIAFFSYQPEAELGKSWVRTDPFLFSVKPFDHYITFVGIQLIFLNQNRKGTFS